MAMPCLRGAMPLQKLRRLPNASIYRAMSHKELCNSQLMTAPPSSAIGFRSQSRRGFAKGKTTRDEVSGSFAEGLHDVGPTAKANATAQMDAAVVALSRDLSKLRTGRASPGILDHIIVEVGGIKMPLNRAAIVSVVDPKTLSVNPYDPNALHKVVTKSCEDIRQSIRRARQKALDTIKKSAPSLSKDDAKRLEKEVDDITKKFVKLAEDICKAKEKEIC